MKILFFFFALIAMLGNMKIIYNSAKYCDYLNTYHVHSIMDLSERDKMITYLHLPYVLWMWTGLLSSQWLIFIAVIAIGFIPRRNSIPNILGVSFIRCVLIALALINALHFNIDLCQVVKSWFL